MTTAALRTRALLSYKIADTDAEFEAIHRLNYSTFVEEISSTNVL